MKITEAPVHASLAAADLARARAWYADKLGWEPTIEPPGVLVYEVLRAAFTLFETPFAGTAKNSVMTWNTDDVPAEVARLQARGVVFEEYDFGDFKTVDGIMSDPGGGQSAWFKDSEGNIIALVHGADDPRRPTLAATIAAADLNRAKAFYGDQLGYTPMAEEPGVFLAYQSGGSSLLVYQTSFAGSAKNTVAVWRLKGLVDEVARLRDRGVVFEEYDLGSEGATVAGILSDQDGPVNAWFKDSEGNVLAIAEDRD